MSSGELIQLMNSNPVTLPQFFREASRVSETAEVPKFGIINGKGGNDVAFYFSEHNFLLA